MYITKLINGCCVVFFAMLCLGGCGDLQVEPPAQPDLECSLNPTTCAKNQDTADAVLSGPLAPPVLDAMPTVDWPYAIIPVRGRAISADRVVMRDANRPENPKSVTVDAQSAFCVDVPVSNLGAAGERQIDVFSFSSKHDKPSPASSVTYHYDPMAQPIFEAATCKGIHPSQCGEVEICNNGKDDDCDGAADSADDSCSAPCTNDEFEANDALATAKQVDFGAEYSHANLIVCPQDVDVFALNLTSGDQLSVSVDFQNKFGNLDLKLYRYEGTSSTAKELKKAETFGDGESLEYGVSDGGTYFVYVSGRNGNVSNTYTLRIKR